MTKNIKFKWCCSVTEWWLTLQPHGLQHARLPCPSLSPRVCSHSCPLSRWYYLTISFPAAPFFFCLQSFPASVFSTRSALHIRWPKYRYQYQLQYQSFQWKFKVDFLLDWLVWSPCSPKDSQESSQFRSIRFFWPSAFFMFQWRLQNNSWTKGGKSMFFNRKIKI